MPDTPAGEPPEHDINCGIDAQRLGEDNGCTCGAICPDCGWGNGFHAPDCAGWREPPASECEVVESINQETPFDAPRSDDA